MTDQQQPGVFVAVVGPSGAGKDSVLRFARERLGDDAHFVFVRRVITRPVDPDAEDHDSLTEPEFAAAVAAGQFFLHWEAHGLRYGIPAGAARALRAGRVVVANLSRHALPDLARQVSRLVVAAITADPEVLRVRLTARGRETAAEIDARVRRAAEARIDPALAAQIVTIDNSGPLDVAGTALVTLLRERA